MKNFVDINSCEELKQAFKNKKRKNKYSDKGFEVLYEYLKSKDIIKIDVIFIAKIFRERKLVDLINEFDILYSNVLKIFINDNSEKYKDKLRKDDVTEEVKEVIEENKEELEKNFILELKKLKVVLEVDEKNFIVA